MREILSSEITQDTVEKIVFADFEKNQECITIDEEDEDKEVTRVTDKITLNSSSNDINLDENNSEITVDTSPYTPKLNKCADHDPLHEDKSPITRDTSSDTMKLNKSTGQNPLDENKSQITRDRSLNDIILEENTSEITVDKSPITLNTPTYTPKSNESSDHDPFYEDKRPITRDTAADTPKLNDSADKCPVDKNKSSIIRDTSLNNDIILDKGSEMASDTTTNTNEIHNKDSLDNACIILDENKGTITRDTNDKDDSKDNGDLEGHYDDLSVIDTNTIKDTIPNETNDKITRDTSNKENINQSIVECIDLDDEDTTDQNQKIFQDTTLKIIEIPLNIPYTLEDCIILDDNNEEKSTLKESTDIDSSKPLENEIPQDTSKDECINLEDSDKDDQDNSVKNKIYSKKSNPTDSKEVLQNDANDVELIVFFINEESPKSKSPNCKMDSPKKSDVHLEDIEYNPPNLTAEPTFPNIISGNPILKADVKTSPKQPTFNHPTPDLIPQSMDFDDIVYQESKLKRKSSSSSPSKKKKRIICGQANPERKCPNCLCSSSTVEELTAHLLQCRAKNVLNIRDFQVPFVSKEIHQKVFLQSAHAPIPFDLQSMPERIYFGVLLRIAREEIA